jgi:hypothetical protein
VRIILKWILNKEYLRVWSEFVWFRIGYDGGKETYVLKDVRIILKWILNKKYLRMWSEFF